MKRSGEDYLRLALLNGDLPALVAGFQPFHERFAEALRKVAAELESSASGS